MSLPTTMAIALPALAVLVAAAVGIVWSILAPPASDLIVFAAFLLVSGGLAIGLSVVAPRLGLPTWTESIRGRFALSSAVTAALALGNVGFVAYLMFLSPHDLAVLGSLLGFSLGISVLVAISLADPFSRGIRDVISTVERMNAGNLAARVPASGRDEIARLAEALNAMAQRLEESFARERGVEAARRDLVRAVSHDLRTPLSSIRGMIESINDGVVADEATVKRYLHTMQTEVESLGQLVSDLFEVSQIDAGALELHLEPSSVRDLISDTLEAIAAQAASKMLKVTGEVDPELAPVYADPPRVMRVLYNLVQNAMRHTPPDGAISIRAIDAGAEVEVQVIDTGEGISEKDLPQLFERGFRADPSRSRQSGGAGLGLNIARGIIEAHGGRIWVRSRPSEGSVFSFTLPKAVAG